MDAAVGGAEVDRIIIRDQCLNFHPARRARGNEGAVSFHEQITSFGWTYWTRNALLGTGLGAALFIAAAAPAGGPALPAWAILSLAVVTACVIGRALFYVLVIPTTMPGAFFWRNKGFEEHARATGLAARAQVGVAPLH